MPVKTINSIEEIYKGKEIVRIRGEFICPVCNKSYKRLKNAENHLAEQECYDIKSMIVNTEREKMANKLFVSIMGELSPRAKTSLFYFRKNKLYAPIGKFSLFCSLYDVKDPELYFAWMRDVVGFKHVNAILSHGIEHENLSKYRMWLREHPEFIDNERYIAKNEAFLDPESPEYDAHFLIRSLEKSHLSIIYYMQFYGLTGNTVKTYNLEQFSRIQPFLKEFANV